MSDTIAPPAAAPAPKPEPSRQNEQFRYNGGQTYDTTKAHLDRLEEERKNDVPKYQKHLTPKGVVEQDVNQGIREDREKRIKALQKTMATRSLKQDRSMKR